MFYFEEIEGRKVLKSTLLDGVEHFFTTREIPLSSGAILELKEECAKNRAITAKYLEISERALISPVQTHTANITIAERCRNDYNEIDSLVLSNKNLAIFLNFADCTPIILWDSKNNVGAVAHAGWRGTAQRIAPKTVEFMMKYYESDPKDIIAAIGPAISMKNYQVGQEVYEKLMSTLENNPVDCWKYVKSCEKYNVDLKRINYCQLAGIGVEKIDLCGYCTYDTNDIFFSYRKENGITARHSAVLKLKD